MKSKRMKLTPEYLKEAEQKGAFLLLEKHLGHLPQDYINCVMVIATQGLAENLSNDGVMIMEEPLSSKYFEALTKEEIPLLVFNSDKSLVWNLLITRDSKNLCPETNDPTTLYIGGENLRIFCDRENIFYRTAKSEDGRLISGSNLTLLKEEGEDCRRVENE